MEYTVHFEKGFRVGTRSLHMVHVEATDAKAAVRKAKAEFTERDYRLTRVDHFDADTGRLVRD